MSSKSNGALLGLPDRFVAVEIEGEASPAFDAAQYSFFGDLSAVDSGLEGALEDGLEGPPPEDGVCSQDYAIHGPEDETAVMDDDEDLSVAAMFRNQLGLRPAKTPTAAKRADPDDDAGLDALLTDPLSEARKHLHDDDYDQRGLPSELYPQASSGSHAADHGHTLFSGAAASYNLFEGYSHALGGPPGASSGAPAPPPPAPSTTPPSATGTSLLQMLKKPSQPPGAMSLEELEARMLGSAAVAVAPGPGAPEVLAGVPGLQVRPLPGQPVPSSARGSNLQQPRLPMSPPVGPAPPGYPPHMQPPSPVAASPGPGMQQPYLHGSPAVHGHMPPPHGPHMMPPPLPSPPGSGPYAQMLGLHGPVAPQPDMMYSGNGMMPPPGHPHHPQFHQQGAMMPPPYGPGSMMGRPFQYGPMGMHAPSGFTHDGYPMRPMGTPPGMHGTMHGMPPRPGAVMYGPGVGPIQSPGQQAPLRGSPRPPTLPGPPPPQVGSAIQRFSAGPSAGAPAPRPTPPRQGSGQALTEGSQQPPRSHSGMPGSAGFGPPALHAHGSGAGRPPVGMGRAPGAAPGGKWMRPEDVDYIVRSMLYSVASNAPYMDDYYFLAFLHKHAPQTARHQASTWVFPLTSPFVPERLRELSEDQMTMMRLDPSVRAKFVEGIHGLGKIVLSNIRTPRVLMDLTDRMTSASGAGGSGTAQASSSAAKEGPGESARSARPLEQEPLLAARIMIEDCMNLLLDVDDIDRLANHVAASALQQHRPVARPLSGQPSVAPAGSPSVTQLRQRRELLLVGINGAFRLPGQPNGTAAAAGLGAEGQESDGETDNGGGAGSLGDGVLLRILALSKGRGMVARALQAIAPPSSLTAPSGAVVKASQSSSSLQESSALLNEGEAGNAGDASAAGNSTDVSSGGAPLLGPHTPSPYVLLWATLRNSWMLFGSSLQQDLDPATERPMLESTARLAAALREALMRLPTARDVIDAAAAFNAGCQLHVEAVCQGKAEAANSMEATLLPLAQTRAVEAAALGAAAATPAAWLGEALAALVTRASQLGLSGAPDEGTADKSSATGVRDDVESHGTASAKEEWRREFGRLYERVSRHLNTLVDIFGLAQKGNNAEALAVVRAMCCKMLVNAMLMHSSPQQTDELRSLLQAFVA